MNGRCLEGILNVRFFFVRKRGEKTCVCFVRKRNIKKENKIVPCSILKIYTTTIV